MKIHQFHMFYDLPSLESLKHHQKTWNRENGSWLNIWAHFKALEQIVLFAHKVYSQALKSFNKIYLVYTNLFDFDCETSNFLLM